MIAGTPSSSPPPGSIPPRPVTIHKSERCSVAFEGYGVAEISGPRRGELAGMVSALPLVLKALGSVTAALRSGGPLPDLDELEAALAEAGVSPGGPAAGSVGAAAPSARPDWSDRLAGLLADLAVRLDALSKDRANFRAPRVLKDALVEMARTARETLADTGYGALLPPDLTPPADAGPDTLGKAA